MLLKYTTYNKLVFFGNQAPDRIPGRFQPTLLRVMNNHFRQFVSNLLQRFAYQARGGIRIPAQGADAPQNRAIQTSQTIDSGFHLGNEGGVLSRNFHLIAIFPIQYPKYLKKPVPTKNQPTRLPHKNYAYKSIEYLYITDY